MTNASSTTASWTAASWIFCCLLFALCAVVLPGCNEVQREMIATMNAEERLAYDRILADRFTSLFQIKRDDQGVLIVITKQGESFTKFRIVRDDGKPDGVRVTAKGSGIPIGPHAHKQGDFYRH